MPTRLLVPLRGTEPALHPSLTTLRVPRAAPREPGSPREAAPASSASREHHAPRGQGSTCCSLGKTLGMHGPDAPPGRGSGADPLARPADTRWPVPGCVGRSRGAGWLCSLPRPPLPSARGCMYLDGPPEPAGCQVSSQRLLGRLPTGLRIPQLRPLGRLLATGRRNRMKRNKRKEEEWGREGRGGGKGQGEEWQRESRK